MKRHASRPGPLAPPATVVLPRTLLTHFPGEEPRDGTGTAEKEATS